MAKKEELTGAKVRDLTDEEIAAVLAHSRALLFPSFAEGLGIPVLEANAAGLQVIASDLPAIREIASEDTVFLNPLDGPGWRTAILAAATPETRHVAAR